MDKTLWRLLYETAARASEALALNVEDLDLANGLSRHVAFGMPQKIDYGKASTTTRAMEFDRYQKP